MVPRLYADDVTHKTIQSTPCACLRDMCDLDGGNGGEETGKGEPTSATAGLRGRADVRKQIVIVVTILTVKNRDYFQQVGID